MLSVPIGIPLLNIEPDPEVYAILLSLISSFRLSFVYFISPESAPSPVMIAWIFPGIIEIGTLEFKSDNSKTLEDL